MEHTHEWKTVMHIDGCHSYSTAFHCECGEDSAQSHEREGTNLYLWAYDDCERCEELLGAADVWK